MQGGLLQAFCDRSSMADSMRPAPIWRMLNLAKNSVVLGVVHVFEDLAANRLDQIKQPIAHAGVGDFVIGAD